MKDNLAICVSNHDIIVSPYKIINAIKKAGFNNVFIQWYNHDLEVPQEKQLEYIKNIGLNVIFAHLGYDNINDIWLEDGAYLVDYYKNDIKVCKDNGINLVVMHLCNRSKAPIYNEIGLKRIKEIVDYADSIGVKIAFENTKIKGYLEYIVDNIDNKNIGICFDAGHYHCHFKDDFDFIKFKDKILAVHLHDNNGVYDEHLLPYDGTLDWDNVINNLKLCNYNGYITLELCYRNDYLNMSIGDFYKKGYEVGKKLVREFNSSKK